MRSSSSIDRHDCLGGLDHWRARQMGHRQVLRICRDGTPILRLTDGSIWARRSGLRAYRVENEQTVCDK